jgi:hypothetical protein
LAAVPQAAGKAPATAGPPFYFEKGHAAKLVSFAALIEPALSPADGPVLVAG